MITLFYKQTRYKTLIQWRVANSKGQVSLDIFYFFIYFLFSAAIAQIFSPIVELANLIRILIKEAKAETEIHPVTEKAKIRKCSK